MSVFYDHTKSRIIVATVLKKTNSIFEATIPKQPENTRVVCHVTVVGAEDLIEEYEFNYQVGETSDFSFFSLEIVAAIIAIILIVLFFSKV